MKSNVRCLLAFFSVVLASSLAGHPAHAGGKPAHRPFYIGADWSDGDSQGAKDLFYETDCNFVRLDGGGFDWATPAHVKALQNFRTHGIYAMLQMGSHWPDWTWDSHTEDYFVDDQGKSGGLDSNHVVNYSGQDWPQFTYASPEYRNYLQATFTKYLKAVGGDPNVVAMQMHNEPGYFWVGGRVFDYNPKAIAAFRLWLPTQYPNISALNASWGTYFASFAEVDPVKQRPPVSNIASWMDWRRFNVKLIHDFLAWEADLGHKLCPKVPSTTNMSGPLDNWYPLRLGDNFQFTQPFDRAAIDIYATQWTNPFFVGYAMDTTRGAAQGRPITVAECGPYDPEQFTKLSDEQCADRLSSDIWRYIGHGATAISIWTLASAQGSRLTTGAYNPRIRAVREIAHLSKMLNLGDFANSPSPVALVANTDSFLYYGGLMP
ncbi:MAG TPA: beta-galactosidase, partial [Capsulimonadaceae bacterium]|nr:beta-galactosidase [Capsulimonadaceae bacterium]